MNYDALFVNPNGRTSRAAFVPALLAVAAAAAFYAYMVGGRMAHFSILVLVYPAFVLLARRLRDLGHSAWLVLVPLVPVLAYFAVLLAYLSFGSTLDAALPWLALAVTALFVLRGCTQQGQRISG